MERNFKWRFAGIGAMLAIIAVFGGIVMLLWNALMPQIFAFPQISYLQAAGLLILARLFFGGIGGHHAGRRGARGIGIAHGNKLREKWMNMSEEERKEFMEKEKDFFDFHRHYPPHHDPFPNAGFPPPHDPFNNAEREKKDEGNE